MRSAVLGGVERGFGDRDGGAETPDRDRGPLVGVQFRLLAGRDLRQQPVAQAEIGRFEIGGLGRGDRARDRRRQLHPRRGQLQRAPCGVDAAGIFRVGKPRLRRDLPGAEPGRDDQRGLAGGVTQQPGDLLDRQQLVDGRVLVIDGGGKGAGKLLQRLQHRIRRSHVFIGQFGTALCLRLGHRFPELLLQRAHRLEHAFEFRHQRLVLREFQAAEQAERVAHRRHFGVADVAQILLDIGVHRRVGIQQPVGGGAVGAQIVHRLEDVRRGVGDDRDAARRLQAAPGVPGIERKSNHHAEGGDEDDGLQQRGYGQTIQHDAPPGRPAIWGKNRKDLTSRSS